MIRRRSLPRDQQDTAPVKPGASAERMDAQMQDVTRAVDMFGTGRAARGGGRNSQVIARIEGTPRPAK